MSYQDIPSTVVLKVTGLVRSSHISPLTTRNHHKPFTGIFTGISAREQLFPYYGKSTRGGGGGGYNHISVASEGWNLPDRGDCFLIAQDMVKSVRIGVGGGFQTK